MTLANEKQEMVTLAGEKYVLKQIPMMKLRQIGPKMTEILADVTVDKITKADPEQLKSAFDTVLERFMKIPYEVIHLFVPTAPQEIFEDEENGVTFPEFYDALKKALEYNRLDVLKNFFMTAATSTLTKKR